MRNTYKNRGFVFQEENRTVTLERNPERDISKFSFFNADFS